MDELEMDGAHAEIERLAALHQQRKPVYSDRFLSMQTPGTEHFGAPPDVELTHDDILGAVRELAEEHGVSTARVRGMVMLTAARAGLGHSPQEEAAVISEVMLTMDAGKMNVSDEQILKLSSLGDDTAGDTIGLAGDRREAVRDEAAMLGLTVTVAQRDKFAKSGVALPSGAFPIHDATHLAAAKSEYKKGNLAGHSRAEVRAHVNKNARRLGLPGLDADEDDVAATMALTQESQAAAMMLSAGQDSADAVIARHPEFAHLFRAGKTSSRKHPRRSGRPITTAQRAHASDTGDEDPSDTDQPARGGEVHRGVREIIEANPDLFTDGQGRDPSAMAAWPSPGAKSGAQREREQQRAEGGHGGRGGRSLEDLSRGSARTRSGR